MPISGRDLRAERRKADISTVDLAAHLRISRQTLWVWERDGAVDLDRAKRYLAAVETLRDARESVA